MKKEQRGDKKLLTLTLLLLLTVGLTTFSSAGIAEWYAKLTGKATSGSTSLNITVGNNEPYVRFTFIPGATNPSEGGTRLIHINFTATDTDGNQNLNSSTAQLNLSLAGEVAKTNTSCIETAASGNDKNYSCSVSLDYYDGSGSWTVNVSIKDINQAYTSNATDTFTYNLLTAMVMSPSAVTWTPLSLTTTDAGSDNDPVLINNTGNAEDLTLNVTGYDLRGETNVDEYIYANNFSIDATSQGCAGIAMANATSLNITTAILQKGDNSINAGDDTSGQEELYFCLKGLPQDISSQSYSSAAYGSWMVEVI